MKKITEPTLRFNTSKKLMLFYLIGASIFVAFGRLILANEPIIGWITIIFFGLVGLVGLLGLLPGGRAYIELSPQGFSTYGMYRKWFFRWSDIQEFKVIKIESKTMVGWNYQPGFRAEGLGRETGRKISFTLGGVEAVFPDLYGMKAEDLAALMNEWRERNSQ